MDAKDIQQSLEQMDEKDRAYLDLYAGLDEKGRASFDAVMKYAGQIEAAEKTADRFRQFFWISFWANFFMAILLAGTVMIIKFQIDEVPPLASELKRVHSISDKLLADSCQIKKKFSLPFDAEDLQSCAKGKKAEVVEEEVPDSLPMIEAPAVVEKAPVKKDATPKLKFYGEEANNNLEAAKQRRLEEEQAQAEASAEYEDYEEEEDYSDDSATAAASE